MRRLFRRAGCQSVGWLTANAALAHIEVINGLTENTSYIRPEEGGGGRDFGHRQLGGKNFVQPGQLIKLMSTKGKSIKKHDDHFWKCILGTSQVNQRFEKVFFKFPIINPQLLW